VVYLQEICASLEKSMNRVMIFFAALTLSIAGRATEIISGTVVSVIDGNTVELVAEDRSTYKVMLHGIDCPELGQDFGDKAKRYLEKLLLDKTVSVELKGKDRWGTRLGIIVIDGEIDPRHELLKEGLAWTAELNPNPELETMKEKARDKGKGLWKQDNPTPPWIYRRQQTLVQVKSSQ
jgi:micrococcal nuclease